MITHKEVEVAINPTNYNYWINRGYWVPPYLDSRGRQRTYKRGVTLKVLVSDLPAQSNVKVEAKCHDCGILRTIQFCQYTATCWSCNLKTFKGDGHGKYRKSNKYPMGVDRSYDNYLFRKYKVTFARYMEMMTVQDSRCAICGKHQSEESRKLVVDHCHKTGKIRGLLCNRCNRGLGIFSDNISLFNKSISYLQRGENA